MTTSATRRREPKHAPAGTQSATPQQASAVSGEACLVGRHQHVRDRLEESETLQQQAQNNTLAQFSASPDLQQEFVSAVIGAMASSEDLSTQILNNTEISQKLLGELVPIIYQGLKTAG
jgi:hypothetical protein